MIQAWMVYRGHEIEKASESEWHVKRNRERVHVAASVADAQAWIDKRRERDFAVRVRDTARRHK